MTKAERYRVEHEKLMNTWAEEVWNWLGYQTNDPNRPVFYKDGLFDPDIWFGSEFRPLFVLKEVYEHDWAEGAEIKYFWEFVSKPEESDAWKREAVMWQKFSVLAQSVLHLNENVEEGLNYEKFYISTENDHQQALRRIAFINLKKVGGGDTVGSEQSQKTLSFECHAEKFRNRLNEQIALLDPTVIICCGRNSVISNLGVNKNNCYVIKNDKGETVKEIPAINGYHPSRNSYENFCGEALKSLQKVLASNN